MFWLILGGFATALAFPLQPHPTLPGIAWWPLAWVGLVPLLVHLMKAESCGRAASGAFVFAVAWFFVDCVWIFRVFDAFGWVLIWIPVAWIVLFGVLAFWVRRAGLSPWWSWPILWIAIEFLRSEWSPIRLDWFSHALDPLRFSWLVLGHSRVTEPFLAQTADIWGGYGLSIAPFLCNLMLAEAIANRRLNASAFVSVCVLVVIEAGYGYWALGNETKRSAIEVGVVQSERESLLVLQEMTEGMLRDAPGIRIIVWPEESIAEKLGDTAIIQALASQHGVYLIVGAEFDVEGKPPENRAYVIPPNGDIQFYRKRERVPFVELHVPDVELRTFPMTIDGQSVRAGVLICYDADFPTTARELARAGAEFFLMPTLDEGGWGGTQHVQHSLLPRLRAIENRRPVVQAATSGVSQIIDDRGRVLAQIPYRLNRRPARATMYLEGTAHAAIVPNAELSLDSRFGFWFGPAIAAAAGLTIIVAFSRRRIQS
jgi:apolipoprotein N-acyltransferase